MLSGNRRRTRHTHIRIGHQMKLQALLFVALIVGAGDLQAQKPLSPSMASAVDMTNGYYVVPNVVYSTGSGYDCKLDAYVRGDVSTPLPVVVVIHGGGWVVGSKEGRTFEGLPYMAMGFHVVNVEYRMASVALAPAAVQDCRRALAWVFLNAGRYHFDTSKVVVTGGSAGGHLALTTGLLRWADGFDMPTDWNQDPPKTHVAAIVNWFGITDVADLLDGANRQQYAVSWVGVSPEAKKIAASVSPLTYVRPGAPPVISIHGNNDALVPYQHAVRLHKALDAAGVANKLITIPGGGHGGFSPADYQNCYAQIVAFLEGAGIRAVRP
jgi:acetyl esterase/lipase